MYERAGRYPEAEKLLLGCLAARLGALGEDHPKTLISMTNLAAVYDSQGKYALVRVCGKCAREDSPHSRP